MTQTPSRTARIRAAAKAGNPQAQSMLSDLLTALFGIAPVNVTINRDRYSLNSLNGFFDTEDGAFFFKFHQEESEEAMSGEYYRADILARAGLPVDQPMLMSTLPGEQILVYRRRHDPRFSDVLRALDIMDDAATREAAIAAERGLSREIMAVYERSLHPIGPDEARAEPIHRLFHQRLVDPAQGSYPGGRLAAYYVAQDFAFPGMTLGWDELSRLTFRINGITHRDTLAALFNTAAQRLEPGRMADAGGVVAHGDAHNANVWFSATPEGASLSLFDPAFAGAHIPTLLAEIKTTFHNVFAHPLWLYDPHEIADRFAVSVRRDGDMLDIETDWDLTPVRRDLLEVKAREIWRPLLALLDARAMLPADWRTVVRLALFLCPTLVMNLRAGAATHTPASSLLALANAVRVGSEPVAGADAVTRFLDSIAPGG